MLFPLDGITLALMAAILFGSSAVTARVALKGANVMVGAALGVLIGVPILLVVAYAVGEFASAGELTITAVSALGFAGLLNFFAGRILTYKAIECVGANRTYALVTTFPVYSAVLAVALLGETLTLNSLLAIVLIVAGGFALARSKAANGKVGTGEFGRGIRLAATAGVLFGVSNFLIRVGVEGTPSPVLDASISFGFALAGYVGLIFVTTVGSGHPTGGLSFRVGRWFLLDGLVRAGALISLYLAFESSPVVVVSPIAGSQSLFAILFTYIAIRKFEVFQLAVVGGAILVLAGVVVLYLPTL